VSVFGVGAISGPRRVSRAISKERERSRAHRRSLGVLGVELSDLPPYKDFLLPVLHAVEALGGTAHAKAISAWISSYISSRATAWN
jgi:hypothetical protein